MRPPLDLRLYAVLDPLRCGGREPMALARAAAAGGATLIQLRDKTSPTREFVARAREVKAALAETGVRLVINDRVDVALAAGADGVHLGAFDMAPADARRLLGPERIVGVTVHHADEADAVNAVIADYAGIGPVYPTASKDPADPPLGPQGFARLHGRLAARLPGFPACGIAGIEAANAAAVIEAGADGIAVISALFMADDVEVAARELRVRVDAALAGRTRPT